MIVSFDQKIFVEENSANYNLYGYEYKQFLL